VCNTGTLAHNSSASWNCQSPFNSTAD
jgi:hypothetical protein